MDEEGRPEAVGRDGWAMLALSGAIIAASLGATLVACVGYVAWIGLTAPASGAGFNRVLVLGMRLRRDGGIPGRIRRRLDRAWALLQVEPAAEAFLLGGITGEAARSEAEAGRDLLCQAGVAAARVHVEQRSRHTLENLRYYRADFPGAARVVLVTNRYHLARTSLLAGGLGLAHANCAAEVPILALPIAATLKEAALVHWYLTGRLYAHLTRNSRMAARIS